MWNQSLLKRWEKGWFQEGRMKIKRTFCRSLLHRTSSYMLGQQQRPEKGNYTRPSFCESKQSFKRGDLGVFFICFSVANWLWFIDMGIFHKQVFNQLLCRRCYLLLSLRKLLRRVRLRSTLIPISIDLPWVSQMELLLHNLNCNYSFP